MWAMLRWGECDGEGCVMVDGVEEWISGCCCCSGCESVLVVWILEDLFISRRTATAFIVPRCRAC